MLTIVIPERELWDEEREELVSVKEQTLQFIARIGQYFAGRLLQEN